MELWIRNQEKDRLIKCQSLDILDRNQSPLVKEYFGEIEFNVMIIGNETVNLGTYPKKRALEILDEIEDLIMGKTLEKHINKFDTYNSEKIKVYEMPEE